MSGAKNCPETPRQRMIGMMYLVLTAMLALNVSSEILNGFTLVDNSLHTTIESSEIRNKDIYADFQHLYQVNPGKVKEWLDQAMVVKSKSDELYSYIQTFKQKLVQMVDEKQSNDSAYVRQIIAKDNLDKPEQYAILDGNGKILRQKIEDYKNFLIKVSANNPVKQKMYEDMFATKGGPDGKSWEQVVFEMMPVSAVITVLTKYQSDVRSSEAEVVQYLKGQMDVKDFRVNKVVALVVPNSKYVIRGGKYSANIVLSASDSTAVPEVYVGSTLLNKQGLYEFSCGKTGSFNYSGVIKLKGSDGSISTYPFKSDYIVGEPSATLSNEDLNVVYKGIDNKFSISVPGVASENVSVRVTGGTARQIAGGKYIIRANQDGSIKIAVYAKIDGKDLVMGGGDYRVKYLPNPTAYLQYTDAGGVPRQIQDGTLTKRMLRGDDITIIASYGEDELIKANFTVTSFKLVSPFGAVTTNGSKFNDRMQSDINKLEGGDVLTIKNVKAVGPDGKIRSLGLIQIQI